MITPLAPFRAAGTAKGPLGEPTATATCTVAMRRSASSRSIRWCRSIAASVGRLNQWMGMPSTSNRRQTDSSAASRPDASAATRAAPLIGGSGPLRQQTATRQAASLGRAAAARHLPPSAAPIDICCGLLWFPRCTLSATTGCPRAPQQEWSHTRRLLKELRMPRPQADLPLPAPSCRVGHPTNNITTISDSAPM